MFIGNRSGEPAVVLQRLSVSRLNSIFKSLISYHLQVVVVLANFPLGKM